MTDIDDELRGLAAETLALQMLVTSLMRAMPDQEVVRKAFDEADSELEIIADQLAREIGPTHAVDALGVLENLRGTVLQEGNSD